MKKIISKALFITLTGLSSIVAGADNLNRMPNRVLTGSDTIAYIATGSRPQSIRLVSSNGGQQQELWRLPDNPLIEPTLAGLVWRPDGSALTFTSDHAFGTSLYGRDLYTITLDSGAVRKITGPPETHNLMPFRKGVVKLNSRNMLARGTDFWAYLEGANRHHRWRAATAENWTITFDAVADFGLNQRQYAVLGYIGHNGRRLCRYDLAAVVDVEPDKTLTIQQQLDAHSHLFRHCRTVHAPAWSHDGQTLLFVVLSKVSPHADGPGDGRFESYSLRLSATEPLNPVNKGSQQAALHLFANDLQHIKLSPIPDNQLLLVRNQFHADRVYLSAIDDQDLGKPDNWPQVDLGFCFYTQRPNRNEDRCQITAIEWLPNGSGFMVAVEVISYQGFNTEDKKDYRLYQHDLKTGNTRLLLSLDDYIGHFSIAPEAKRIAFERGKRREEPYSIWIYDLPTKQLRHLVDNGSTPAWGR